MVNPLIGSAIIGAGASIGSGIIGSITGSAHRQYKYQKRLMDRQQQYNVQNATTAYNRSRQLTQDTAMLEKLGKQQAGINTAFGQDGNVTNAASAPQADGVSVPSPPDVSASSSALSIGINNAVQNLIGVATAKANIRKLTSEAEGNEIDNLTRNIRNLKEVGLKNSQIAKNFAEFAYQKIVNKYADSRLSAEADSANSQAIIDQADSGVRSAMNKLEYDLKVQEIFNKVQTGVLTQRQAMTELKKLSVMDSEINLNNSMANELDTRSALNVENTRGVSLDNRLKTLTFDNKLVESFESAEQSKLKTVGMKLKNLPHSVSEHFTRSALFALDRIQKGHGSAADFALVAAQTSREYAQFANNEAKDWVKIILGALPMSSSGSAQTAERGSGYVVNTPYVPQY